MVRKMKKPRDTSDRKRNREGTRAKIQQARDAKNKRRNFESGNKR